MLVDASHATVVTEATVETEASHEELEATLDPWNCGAAVRLRDRLDTNGRNPIGLPASLDNLDFRDLLARPIQRYAEMDERGKKLERTT